MTRFSFIFAGLFSFLSSPAFARDWNIKAGVALPLEAKFNILTQGSKFSPFQCAGLDGVLRITETDERTLFFQPKVGFRDDFIDYPLEKNVDFRLSKYIICINPQIFIPLSQKISYVVGFGIDWAFGYSLSFASSQGSGYGDLDQIDVVIRNSHSAIPFINTGVSFSITTHVFCGVNLKQTFLNYLGKDYTAKFDINNIKKVINLSYQPTYIGIELGYFF